MPPATMPFWLAAHSVGSKASEEKTGNSEEKTGIYAASYLVYTGLMMFNACAQYYLAILSLYLCTFIEKLFRSSLLNQDLVKSSASQGFGGGCLHFGKDEKRGSSAKFGSKLSHRAVTQKHWNEWWERIHLLGPQTQ